MESAPGLLAAAGSTSFSYFPQVSVARFSAAARLREGERQRTRATAEISFIFLELKNRLRPHYDRCAAHWFRMCTRPGRSRRGGQNALDRECEAPGFHPGLRHRNI